jgi:hypothetical protein
VAEILKTVGQVDQSAQPAVVALATRATLWLFIAHGVLAVSALIGFVWLTIAIARGKTLYPRWVAFANPLVCMLAGSLLDRVLPQPLELLLSGAGLSLGMRASRVTLHVSPFTKTPQMRPTGRPIKLTITQVVMIGVSAPFTATSKDLLTEEP